MALKIEGEERIRAPIATVWSRLNDPMTLAAAIPGCDQLDQVAERDFVAHFNARWKFFNLSFRALLTIEDVRAPHSLTIVGRGKSIAKGTAHVRLAADGDEETILTYTAQGKLGGKLAPLGNRLALSLASRYAARFFANFSRRVVRG